ncbi:MAG: UvrD-helicase domain-containing protein, partial [Calditrichia bacterium]|nr:UvrD-helicase domain-containing protein [Calditrichia bacterium]
MKDNCGVKISNLPENILKIIYYYSPWFYSEKDHKRGLIASVEKKLKNKIKYDEIKLSSLLKASNLRNIDEDNWLYIIDDLKWKEWEKHSNHLVSNFFIPLFYGNNPILFISPHINKFNKSSVINPEDVHSHWKIPTSVLAIEQMNFLINAKGINTNPDFSYYYDWIDENVKKWYREDSTRGKSIKIENDIIKILHPFHKEWYYVSNFKLKKENSKMGEKEFSYTDFYNEKNANDGNKNTTQPVNIDVKAALDEYQYKAVLAANAPVQVLAPAGSGKTRTLIYRIINLIQKGTRADRILALAFNRKAMLEMRARLEEMGIKGVKI